GLLVGLAGGAGAGRDGGQLKPGVVLQQGDKPLPHHAGAADDAHSVLFHNQYLHRHSILFQTPVGVRGIQRISRDTANPRFTDQPVLYYTGKDGCILPVSVRRGPPAPSDTDTAQFEKLYHREKRRVNESELRISPNEG